MGYLTYFDFIVSEGSYYIATLFSEEYSKYTFLQRIRDNVNNLPEIKKYYSKDGSFKEPFVTETIAAVHVKL